MVTDQPLNSRVVSYRRSRGWMRFRGNGNGELVSSIFPKSLHFMCAGNKKCQYIEFRGVQRRTRVETRRVPMIY